MTDHTGGRAPLVIPVARAVLEEGTVRIDGMLPKAIELRSGQPLHLHFQYRFAEAGREQEEFRVQLRSRLSDQEAPEAHHHFRDHLLLPDAEWGFVRQVYDAPAPGKHELFVDVEAQYARYPWKKEKREESLDRSQLTTTVPVRVLD